MSARARKLINAIDYRANPHDMANEFYNEGHSKDFQWMLQFMLSFVNFMGNLEQYRGGYRSLDEIDQGHFCKTLDGYIGEMNANQSDD